MRIRKLRTVGTRYFGGAHGMFRAKDYAWRKMRNRLRKAGNRSSRKGR